MHFRLLIVACLLALLPMMASASDMVVIVNPRSGIDRLSRDEVINIFLGRSRQLPSGLSAQPIDLTATHPDKASFYRRSINKELAEINSYGARLVFSGRTTPPMQAASTEDLLEIVGKTPGSIGYLERSQIDAKANAVLELGAQ